MLFFLVSFLSFLLLLTKPLPLLLPSWANELRLLFVLLSQELLFHSIQWFENYKLMSAQILKLPLTMFANKKRDLKVNNVKEKEGEEEEEEAKEARNTILDLPELALELILEKLPPHGLLNMASVCTSLRDRCRSEYLWERHFREKWGRVVGQSARREWESYCASSSSSSYVRKDQHRSRRFSWLIEALPRVWPFNSWLQSKEDNTCSNIENKRRHSLVDSTVAWYLALESGRFWFPAQVYNREVFI